MENKQRPIPQIFPHTICPYGSRRSDNPQRPIPGKLFGKILEGVIAPEPLFSSKEEAKKYLEERVTQRRNAFIKEYKDRVHGSRLLTYEPALDREVYKALKDQQGVHEEAHQEVLWGLNSYTRFQVETFIGERLNVGLSKFRYDMRFGNDGKGILHGQGMEEALIDMIARGKDCRNELADDVDHPRQVAEVTQFQKIQEVLGEPQAEIGTTIISFSPPGKEGSAYAHNFYDVFILKEESDKTGEITGKKGKTVRYVEARRYASGLSIEQSLQKAEELSPGFTKELQPEEAHVDAFLIAHPVVINSTHELFNNPDGIHKSLQGDKKAMSYEDFQKKVVQDETFSAMVDHYIQTLEITPEKDDELKMTLNAIMNRADEAAGLKEPVYYYRREKEFVGPRPPLPIMLQIQQYGRQEVRSVDTGCGFSGGVGQASSRFGTYGADRLPSNMSPKKSSDVSSGEDKYGSRTFECPECHETNYRPYNELLPKCQYCGTTKVAC